VKNRSAPEAAVVPIVIYEDVRAAIEWLCRAFGFTERLRAERDGEVGHAQLSCNGGAIMLGRAGGPYRAPDADEVSGYVHVMVSEVESHCRTAQECGARILHPPADMPFGVRQYTAVDHEGHWWTFSENIADVAPADWGARTPADA